MRIALCTPVTPTRERPIRTSGEEAWRSSVRIRGSMSSEQDTSFVRLVSLACHDLRTPLATVHGFARTIARTDDLEEPTSRYVAMIETASGQMADLLADHAGLGAGRPRRGPPRPRRRGGGAARAHARRLGRRRGGDVARHAAGRVSAEGF